MNLYEFLNVEEGEGGILLIYLIAWAIAGLVIAVTIAMLISIVRLRWGL